MIQFAKTMAVIVLLLTLAPLPALAQSNSSATESAPILKQHLQPYLSPTTFGVVQIDLQSAGVGTVIQRLARSTPTKSSKAIIERLGKAATDFRAAKFNSAAIIFDVDSKSNLRKRLILVCPANTQTETLQPLVEKYEGVLPPITIHVFGKKPDKSHEPDAEYVARLASAFKSNPNAPIQAAFALSHNLARSLREMAPKRYGGTTEQSVTRLKWATISLEPENKASLLNAKLMFRDSEAKTAMGQKISAFVKSLESPQQKTKYPKSLSDLLAKTRITHHSKHIQLQLLDGENNASDKKISQFLIQSINSDQRIRTAKNIHKIGCAIHTFHDVNNRMPSFAHVDKDKKPLLSWRVMILPYLDGGFKIYKQFKLDEPWDSEHNKKLIDKIPNAFRSTHPAVERGKTTMLAPRNDKIKTAFDVNKFDLMQLSNADGTSNTIMLVNAAPSSAVPWTKPDDFQFNAKNPVAGLVEKNSTGFQVAMADISLHFLPRNIDAKKLLALFGRNDGSVGSFQKSSTTEKKQLPVFWFFEFLAD